MAVLVNPLIVPDTELNVFDVDEKSQSQAGV